MQIMKSAKRVKILAMLCAAINCEVSISCYGAGQPDARRRQEVFVIVKGVTNPFATFGLLKHLEQIPGVEHVTFSLLHGLADLRLKPGAQVTDAEIRQAIRSASYTPGDVTWSSGGPPVGNEPEVGGGH